jgi:ABC-type multidrug transport system fused ATPase/permease subunit
MNMIQSISSILPNSQKAQILILFIMTLMLAALEILSLSSIPILIGSILTGDVAFINSVALNDFISKLDIKIICFLVVIIFVVKNSFVMFFNYFTFNLNYKINTNLSKRIFQDYLYSDYLTLSKIKTSDMIRNLTTEVNGFVSCINNFIQVFKDIVILSSILILIITVLDKKFFFIFFIFLLLTSVFYLMIKNFLRRIGKETVLLRSKYIETITDSFQLIKEIIINAKKDFFINKYYKNLKLAEKNNLKSSFVFTSGRAIFEVIAVIMMISLVLYLNSKDYEITFIISYLSLIGISVIRSVPLFNSILTSLNKLQYKKPSIVVIANLIEFTKKKKEIQSSYAGYNKKENFKINFNKNIKIDNLTFSYNKKIVLNNLNLEIKKGEKIVLVGSSGSGKTTLMNILSGLIELNEKKLYVDDVEVEYNNYINYRKIISFMPQESYLMNETIHNNIIFDDKDQENKSGIKELLDTVNISKFIAKLDKNEDEIVTQDGSNISGGEKQRIIFARSLFKNFELLILDEPTSSLDKENSFEIINNIFKKYVSKTIIIVTHKIDPRIQFDRILSLENGKINEKH